MSNDRIPLNNTDRIPDLRFRPFRGESDYAAIGAVITGSSKADNLDRTVSAKDIAAAFANHFTNCDPYKDMIFAEVDGNLVGYARGWWVEERPSLRLYMHSAFLLPAWRRKGIGSSILKWVENRLAERSQTHSPETKKLLQANLSQAQEGAAILLVRSGYQPVRHFDLMVRPNLDNLPHFPLPEGLEIRPVREGHYPAIWESMYESPVEEWGSTEPTEESYQEWQAHPHFQPHLWQIAWELTTNKPVGHVLTFINHAENKQLGVKRGYTEGVGTALKWRRRGIARALISLSLQAQKEAGMTESALVADSQNPFGIQRLYESCGFKCADRDTIYRKSF